MRIAYRLICIFLQSLCLAISFIIPAKAFDSGTYYLVSRLTAKAMTITRDDGDGQLYATLQPVSKNNDAQKWILEKNGDTSTIKSVKHGQYVSLLSNGYISVKPQKTLWNVIPTQNAFLFHDPEGKYAINVEGGSSANNTAIIGYPDDISENSQWLVISANDMIDASTFNSVPLQPVTYDNKHKIYSFNALLAGAEEANRLLTFRRSDVYPSGLYVRKGEIIRLSVEGADRLSILVGPPIISFTEGTSKNIVHLSLTDGVTEFKSPANGMMYFQYIRYSFENKNTGRASVKILSGGEQVPFYIAGQTSKSDWETMLQTYRNAPYIEMIGQRSMITVRQSTYVRSGQNDPATILTMTNNIINAFDDISGLKANGPTIDRPSTHKIHYIEDDFSSTEEIASVYMYATDAMIGMPDESAFDLLRPDALESAWSIWHETGHIYQQDDWTTEGLGETTVNIYSLYIQSLFGQPSRLNEEKSENGHSLYASARQFMHNKQRNFAQDSTFPADSQPVWVKLVMLESLRTGLGDNFYPELHKYYRHHPLNRNEKETDASKLNIFSYRASLVSGFDLTDYFTRWGIQLTDETKRSIKKLNLPAPAPGLYQLPAD